MSRHDVLAHLQSKGEVDWLDHVDLSGIFHQGYRVLLCHFQPGEHSQREKYNQNLDLPTYKIARSRFQHSEEPVKRQPFRRLVPTLPLSPVILDLNRKENHILFTLTARLNHDPQEHLPPPLKTQRMEPIPVFPLNPLTIFPLRSRNRA